MVEAALGTEIQEPVRTPIRVSSNALKSMISFVVILLIIAIVWEGIKLAASLNNYETIRATDYNLPHLWDIFGSFLQPAQRNGPLLSEILVKAALFTWGEAAFGFTLGSLFGFVLAVIFAQSRLLERGMMPFVVASQTVPILAVAPMIVIGLSNLGTPRWMSVSLIAAYLSFFPVTINTLRGLTSIPTTALELMESYAATRRQILWKLRVPHALPYIFTALKISATASVVGAIIGELPSSIADGLGGSILNFNQYYNSAPPRLWATNIVAALVGILFFAGVSIAERIIVRWTPTDRSQA